ncbi:MAG: DUF3782 domain-containing protein [Magnetococcales bacterium]|nr:DUF3782 domain-containing protein [Magnetococcales bacterium]
MSRTVTIDDIWKLFEETNRLFRQSQEAWERQRQEDHRKAEEERRKAEEERRKAEEESRKAEEERRKAEEESRKAEEERRKAEEERRKAEEERRKAEEESRKAEEESRKAEMTAFQEKMDRRQEKSDRDFARLQQELGRFGNRWGEFVEEMVAPACETLFADRGIPVYKVSRRVKARLPGNRQMEIDLLVVDDGVVIPVEVKSKLSHDDVLDHLRRLAEFKEFFKEYADKKVMGAVAGIVVEDNVKRFAMNEGLFLIVQSGESVILANSPDFVPRSW